MRKLTGRQLINSLIFPVGIIVWALFCFFRWALIFRSLLPVFMFQWSFLISAGVCGVIPVILTLAAGAETGQYFLPRFLISLSTLGIIGIASEFVFLDDRLMIMLLITSLVVSAIYFYKSRPTKFSEWLVIFLANPVLAALIYYIMLFIPNEILT